MRQHWWIHLSLAALMVSFAHCHQAGSGGRWPAVNPGCRHVKLLPPGEAQPSEYQEIREFAGNWDEPDKDLRHWLINKACEAGADAVVDVVETKGRSPDGPVWNIRGTAVVWNR